MPALNPESRTLGDHHRLLVDPFSAYARQRRGIFTIGIGVQRYQIVTKRPNFPSVFFKFSSKNNIFNDRQTFFHKKDGEKEKSLYFCRKN